MKRRIVKNFGLVCASISCWFILASGACAVEEWKTQEYWNSTGLNVINAAAAYVQGYTGAGVTLGIMDSGVRSSHVEFANKAVAQVFMKDYEEDWAKNDHGSHVAGIMAANRDGRAVKNNMHGVAFDADLTSLGVVFGGWDASEVATALQTLGSSGVRAINHSWGNPACVYLDLKDGKNLQLYRDDCIKDPVFAAMYDMAYDDGIAMVISAGNYGNLGPILPASLRTFYPELTSWTSVIALDSANVVIDDTGKKTLGPRAVISFSNLAFGAEDYSILASGVDINSVNANYDADKKGDYQLMSGTSMAAPYVTGALGLVQQAYPWMSGRNLTDTVLSTADRNFDHADYHVAVDEYHSSDWKKNTIALRLFFTDGRTAPVSMKDAVDALTEYYEYKTNSKVLAMYYGIDSLDTFIRLISGDVKPEELRYKNGKPAYDVVLSGDVSVVSFESVYGQGILDVEKAVSGLAQLNANRMTSADIDRKHGLLYPVNFDDSYSTFSNDIDQQGWIESHHLVDETVPELSADYALMKSVGDKVGFLKDGTGTLYLTGTNSYEGDTVIRGGALSITPRPDGTGGELLSSDVYVEVDGTLKGSGVIVQSVKNEGTVAPGNSIGTLTVGSYSGSGILEMEYEADGSSHDVLNVTGDASVSAMNLKAQGYFSGQTPLTLSVNDLIPTGGTLTVDDPELYGTASLNADYDGSGTITITRAANGYQRHAQNAGNFAAGVALDKGAFTAQGDVQDLIAALDSYSDLELGDLNAALNQLHPEGYDVLLYSALTNNQRLSGMIADRMTGAQAASGHKWNWYFQPFGAIGRQNSWDDYGGYKSRSSGVLIGGEKRRGDWTLGVHGGFIHDSTNVFSASPLSSTSDGGFIGLHAKRTKDPEKGLFVYGLGRVGWDRYETTRNVGFSDYYRSNTAKWTGFSGALEIGAGWNHRAGKVLVTPVASLNYAVVTRPGFNETGTNGGGSALHLDSSNYQSLRSSLGVKLGLAEGKLEKGTRYAIDASALWRHEFLDHGPNYSWTLAGGGTYTSWRESAGRDSVALALGAEFSDTGRFSVKAAVGTELFRPGYSEFSGSLKLEWEF